MSKSVTIFLALFLILGCKTQQGVQFNPLTEEEYELRNLDTLEVSAPPLSKEEAQAERDKGYYTNFYKGSHKLTNRLKHTKLDLRFNWEKEEVIGKATLTLEPYFYPVRELVLDAKNFRFQQISFEGSSEVLNYKYDNKQVIIDLGKPFQKGESYTIYIEYIAQPKTEGGSAAITSDQGLFFIKSGSEPDQIWTQGETEWNSRWFPTIDKPNVRCTQEMYLTVADRFVTLSNGLLEKSTQNSDGTRTDYWKMDLPHAPYLFMIAVGEFAVVKEMWEDIPLSYYVDPVYKASAKAIFGHTPEMLSFFSEKFGVKYPWSKYAQIVVKDYVSGAMENTTAVIYGDFVQKTARELADDHNDNIVAHELAHHWFGDYVTCESWANLTLNEGFANYSEYLWLEHKYGKAEAEYFRYTEKEDHLFASRNKKHPLIYFGFKDKEDMFDSHSYNKGGAVMHMLRDYVGDKAFFAGIKNYLTENAFRSAEIHDLRLAFEEITGEDLNWFFNQWFLDQGHPELDVTFDYDKKNQMAIVQVEQTQSPEQALEIFEIPIAIDLYNGNRDGSYIRKNIWLTQSKQTFKFKVDQQPALINFDPGKVVLSKIWTNTTDAELAFQLTNCQSVTDRNIALDILIENQYELETILPKALKDSFEVIRLTALEIIDLKTTENIKIVQQLALNDPKSSVRTTALERLLELEDKLSSATIAEKILETEKSYSVIAAALELMESFDKQAVLKYAEQLEQENSNEVLRAVSTIYGKSGNVKYLSFFERNIDKVDGFESIAFAENYLTILSQIDIDQAISSLSKIRDKALSSSKSSWQRLAIANTLNSMRNEYRKRANKSKTIDTKNLLETKVEEITVMFKQIKELEKDEKLKYLYDQYELIEKSQP